MKKIKFVAFIITLAMTIQMVPFTAYSNVSAADGNEAVVTQKSATEVEPAEGVDLNLENSEILLMAAAAAIESGDYTYTVNSDGVTAAIASYIGSGGNVTVPEKIDGYLITVINSSAFFNCTGLTDITIPSSVQTIGSEAFYGCTGITSIIIPKTLTSYGTYYGSAFKGSGLTTVTFESGTTAIPDYAFYGCKNLINISIPDTVNTIGAGAFGSCTGLPEISLPAFNNTRLYLKTQAACTI